MPIPIPHYTPYSEPWFAHLAARSPEQAEHIRLMVGYMGKQICMVCFSHDNVEDYKPAKSPLTRRLCDECYQIQYRLTRQAVQNGH